ncbi:MAG: Do family serine endopeptidase, partial [Rickettsiales bacterium]|nr:Do family serine endopeptidase [Rickettsiales bacterium]
MIHRLILFTLCIIMPATLSARAPQEGFADLVETLSPAVVNISTKQRVIQNKGFGMPKIPEGEGFESFKEFFDRFGEEFNLPQSDRDITSLGSGFVIDPKGYIVTNNHVISDGKEIIVTFQDESEFKAKVLGRDPKTDLALIKIEAEKMLPYVSFGNSDNVRAGDWVIAIGNPFGLGGSVSAGIVSARSRNINSGPFDDFIQTDAAINRGNSGGPLFNTQGEVIGVNSAIFSPSGGNVGIGFSIPSALAEPVLKQLREHGRTYRGWLGVKIQHVTDELADSLGLSEPKGALVLEVTVDSPAEKAGVESGDLIIEFDGRKIKEMRQLPRLVAETEIGKKTKMKVLRKGKEKSLTIKLGEMQEDDDLKIMGEEEQRQMPKGAGEEFLGMRVLTLTKALAGQNKLSLNLEGV